MASFEDAAAAVARVFDVIDDRVRMRPDSAGVVPLKTGFGLKVVLPGMPDEDPPEVLFGVPIEYHVAASPPEMLSGPARAWRDASRRRRAGS